MSNLKPVTSLNPGLLKELDKSVTYGTPPSHGRNIGGIDGVHQEESYSPADSNWALHELKSTFELLS